MTDNEIIKALECCTTEGKCNECPANPHRGNYGFCTAPLIKASYYLINRQRAEIEDLKDKNEHLTTGMAVGMCKRIKDKPIIPCCYDNFCSYGERKEQE